MRGAVLIVVLAGCWTEVPTRSTMTTATPVVAERSVAPIDRSPRLGPGAHRDQPTTLPRHSIWQGTYVCSQGITAVRFELDLDGAGAVADAMFAFGPDPNNPRTVPEGVAHLHGASTANTDGTYLIDVDPFEWVNQPPGYFMVGVTAMVDAQLAEMHGRMKADTCGRFDVVRVRN